MVLILSKTKVYLIKYLIKFKTNIPKCPTCGSTNIEKISATKKITGEFLFGIFNSDVRKTFHCKNCNYKW